MAHTRYWLAAALGLCMAHPLFGAERAPLGMPPSPTPRQAFSLNQTVANTIADHLRQSGQLRRFNVDITFRDGLVELTGTVTDQMQREEVLRIVQGVPGVERVRDHLRLTGNLVTQTAAQTAQVGPNAPELNPVPKKEAAAKDNGAKGNGMVEPMPIFQAAPPYDLNPPKMPPYAWPTYAPYNNVSRVAYPTLYPYNAWPFIGPVHPFPKIPLGWRSVKLQWQDGNWWYSKTATGHDWWRLKFY